MYLFITTNTYKLIYMFPFIFVFQTQALYSRIAIALWKSSQGLGRHMPMQNTATTNMCTHGGSGASNTLLMRRQSSKKFEKRAVGATESQVKIMWRIRENNFLKKITISIIICIIINDVFVVVYVKL